MSTSKRKSSAPANPSPKPKRRQSLNATSTKKRVRDAPSDDELTIDTPIKVKRTYRKKSEKIEDIHQSGGKTPMEGSNISAKTPNKVKFQEFDTAVTNSGSSTRKPKLDLSIQGTPITLHEINPSSSNSVISPIKQQASSLASSSTLATVDRVLAGVAVQQDGDKLHDEEEILHLWSLTHVALTTCLSTIIPVFVGALLLSWYCNHAVSLSTVFAGATVTYCAVLVVVMGPYFFVLVPFILIARQFTKAINSQHTIACDEQQLSHSECCRFDLTFFCRITALIVFILMTLTAIEFA